MTVDMLPRCPKSLKMRRLSWSCHNQTRRSSESRMIVHESGHGHFFPTLKRFLRVSTNSQHYLDGTSQACERNQSRSLRMTLPTCGQSASSIIRVGFVLEKERVGY